MAAWLHAAILIASGHPKAMMDFAHAKIAAISEVRSLSGKISVFSWVSQNIFPGPHPLAVVRRRKQDVFPEGHFQGHVAATGWDSPPAPPLHACCLLNFNSHGSQQGLSTVSRPLSHPEPAQSLDRLQSEAAAGKFLQAHLAGERSSPGLQIAGAGLID
jgi:hypothetical protein